MSNKKLLDSKQSWMDWVGKLIFIIGLAASCFHVYVSATGILEAYKMRTTHLMFLLPLTFLIYPMRKKGRFSQITVIDFVWFLATLASMVYLCRGYFPGYRRTGGHPSSSRYGHGNCMSGSAVLCLLRPLSQR